MGRGTWRNSTLMIVCALSDRDKTAREPVVPVIFCHENEPIQISGSGDEAQHASRMVVQVAEAL
jgi:hypothetical protein